MLSRRKEQLPAAESRFVLELSTAVERHVCKRFREKRAEFDWNVNRLIIMLPARLADCSHAIPCHQLFTGGELWALRSRMGIDGRTEWFCLRSALHNGLHCDVYLKGKDAIKSDWSTIIRDVKRCGRAILQVIHPRLFSLCDALRRVRKTCCMLHKIGGTETCCKWLFCTKRWSLVSLNSTKIA